MIDFLLDITGLKRVLWTGVCFVVGRAMRRKYRPNDQQMPPL